MRGLIRVAALSLVARDAAAHYIFNQLTTGGAKHAVYQYIRQNSNYNSPVTDLASPDLRCNVGGASGAGTETILVQAGDPFTFSLDTPVYHQGPVSLYMSKAPGAAADYDGSGGWFKIYDWGPSFSGGSASWVLSGSYTFNIPKCIPDGEYLLRIQSLGIHNPWPAGIPQFYVSCAQVKVGGGGSASPPTVSIPGAFKETDPGYTANIYSNFNSYTVPGPAVWTCSDSSSGGSSGGSSEGSSGGSTGGVTSQPPSQPTTTLLTSTRSATAPTSTPAGCSTTRYGQCGGIGFNGCASCASGATCSKINDYYSQCV